MTFEHVTITEEVQTKDGLVTQERVTLQYTPDPVDDPVGNAAMSVMHPDFLPASELVYTYNEATGMSESAPRVDEPPVDEAVDEGDEDLVEDASDEADQEDPDADEDDDEISPAQVQLDDITAAMEYDLEAMTRAQLEAFASDLDLVAGSRMTVVELRESLRQQLATKAAREDES